MLTASDVGVWVGVAMSDASWDGLFSGVFSVAVLARFVGAELNDPHAERRKSATSVTVRVFCIALNLFIMRL
jgi:hypothetical protein